MDIPARDELRRERGRTMDKIPIGISTCLLGHSVRFDGGHKRDRYITDTLSQYFEWVPFCPEVSAGLGVPRPTLRLQRRGKDVRVEQPSTGTDHTENLTQVADEHCKRLSKTYIAGYLLKSGSPSCGKGGIKIYSEQGIRPEGGGVGVFAEALKHAFPHLPIEDEGRLCDPGLRENWVARVFIYHHVQKSLRQRPSPKKLIELHSRLKYVILAHCPKAYSQLGRLVAQCSQGPIYDHIQRYESVLMDSIKKIATRNKHRNVLLHILGYFKKTLSVEVRKELLQSIDDYSEGILPLVVPVTLLSHYAKLEKIPYLLQQIYLQPHPKELGLRNSI